MIIFFKTFLERFDVHLRKAVLRILIVGHLYHVVFAEFRQDLIDVVVEQLIGRKQDDLPGVQIAAITIEQISHALQHGRRFSGTGCPLNEQQIRLRIADNLVLFFLNRRNDALHFDVGRFIQNLKQHLIAHRFIRVKYSQNLAVIDHELAFQGHVNLALPVRRRISGFAETSIVINA